MIRPLLLALALLGLPGSAAAQAREPCNLVFEANPNHPALFSRLPSGATNVFAGGGVRGVCQGQDIVVTADSAEYYGDLRTLYLLGNVRYREPRARLESQKLTYTMLDERLVAEGNVLVTLASGITARGPLIDYLRAAPAVRQVSRMEAPRRTVTRIPQQDSVGRERDTVQVEADRTVSFGDTVVHAAGAVRITRRDMLGTSDSAFMDTKADIARLIGRASLDSRGERPFRLAGASIELFSQNRRLERVLARTGASATSEDMILSADTIDLRVREDELQRAFAWGPSRARVTSPGRVMRADSLDILMPGQRVMEVRLLRDAYAESVPDTMRIRVAEPDWLRGDTIVALFDTARTATDTGSASRIRELIATGRARSFYHVASDRAGPTSPAVNYVRGRQIVVTFREEEVDEVQVRDAASGVYLEPREPRPAAAGTAAQRP